MVRQGMKIYSEILKDTINLFTDYTEEEVRCLLEATKGMTQEEKADYLVKIHATKKTFSGSKITGIKENQQQNLFEKYGYKRAKS